jgi:hypothetical protein
VQSCLGFAATPNGVAGTRSLAHSLRGPSPEPVPVARYVLTIYYTRREAVGGLALRIDANRRLCDEGKSGDFCDEGKTGREAI